ncbi:MAG: amidinotransferase [Bacteroidetes bacterium GWF2_40_14]|nr:MAG: amidinotransferase [Bacteroidetes bacterium GWF2_40_14]
MQTTSTVLMVRPVSFGFNEETAANNSFQKKGFEKSAQEMALEEFDNFTSLLRAGGVEVLVVQDTPEPHTPDSVFPNNWFSTHEGGTLVLYPMFAKNRRLERKPGVLELLKSKYKIKRVVDLTEWEEKSLFLEGTGSMIADRDNNLIYACKSPRTDESVLEEFCDELDFDYYLFSAYDNSGGLIYHTNVMMCVATKFVVACLDSIRDINERQDFIGLVEESDKELIEISLEQMNQFAGNMIELSNKKGEPLLIMSATAKRSLTAEQLAKLESYCKIVAPELSVIENNGGGSARCMIAEIFF